jgi:hypothetical protein
MEGCSTAPQPARVARARVRCRPNYAHVAGATVNFSGTPRMHARTSESDTLHARRGAHFFTFNPLSFLVFTTAPYETSNLTIAGCP